MENITNQQFSDIESSSWRHASIVRGLALMCGVLFLGFIVMIFLFVKYFYFNNTLDIKRIRLLDHQGIVRLELAAEPSKPMLSFKDANGILRFLVINDDNSSALEFLDNHGFPIMAIEVDGNRRSSELFFFNSDGKPNRELFKLQITQENGPRLIFRDKNGKSLFEAP